MPFDPGPLRRVKNVQWGGPGFLYSDSSGMFGSSDGIEWKEAPSSVYATSLAWADNVWLACNRGGGCWISLDGAKSWLTTSAPTFREIAAMQPEGTDAAGNPLPAVFAGWKENEDGNAEVYVSIDRGQTWAIVLIVNSVVLGSGPGGDGYESVNALSGCGGALFITTQRGEGGWDNGSAWIFVSIDGGTFSKSMLFGPGTNPDLSKPANFGKPSKSYGGGHVGFDNRLKQYIATGYRSFGSGVIGSDEFGPLSSSDQSLIYTSSGSPSLAGGEGAVIATNHVDSRPISKVWDILTGPYGCAGGDGTFVLGGMIIHDSGRPEASYDMMAYPAGGPLASGENAGQIGSFCHKGKTFDKLTEASSDEPVENGLFACVAYSGTGDHQGGCFIGIGGEFSLSMSGTGPGAVGVGKLSWSTRASESE